MAGSVGGRLIATAKNKSKKGAPSQKRDARFTQVGPSGTAEHPINQVLKFGLSSNVFAHEVV
jgi:hypothetical protein